MKIFPQLFSLAFIKNQPAVRMVVSSVGATVRTAVDETSEKGEFKRTDAAWRDWIKKDGKFPPEANRCKFQLRPAHDGWGQRGDSGTALSSLIYLESLFL